MSTTHKIGFWSLFAVVVGSQIGSGVLNLPTHLAPYGLLGLWGWVLSAGGAVVLSMIFAFLCAKSPQTGGPHVYVKQAFGEFWAFFTGWTYWVISWASTTAVVIASIAYISPVIGIDGEGFQLILELLLVIVLTLLNLRGVEASGRIEFVLTLVKVIPLVVIPVVALCFFDVVNINLNAAVADEFLSKISLHEMLGQITLLTLWGFIGLECATVPAESVTNAKKTVPRATVLGTMFVALIYLINSLGIMGVIPVSELRVSGTPYADVANLLFGGNWSVIISLLSAVICIGSLNAWMLISGQIAWGLAQDKLMPMLFLKKNKNSAPTWGILISSIGTAFLLLLMHDKAISTQLRYIIDVSVVSFLSIYLICALGFIKIFWQNSKYYLLLGVLGAVFCGWVIYETSLEILAISALFIISGVPVYFYCVRKNFTKLSSKT